nr:hypothetical protein [Tanacetum cinerariifolium]
IVRQILLAHPLSYALTTTIDVPAVYLQQFWRTMYKVPDTEDTIKIVGQILLAHPLSYALITTTDVPAVYLQQFWRTMYKKKEAIQYPHFIKLIVADLMKKFPKIPKRIEEDYHSIKDDVLLIRETNDFKEYETVFIKVDVLINQPQPVVYTHRMHRITPRAPRSPTASVSPLEMKKRKQIARESSSPRKSLKVTIKQKEIVDEEKDDVDSEDSLEPESHKENPKVVDDDDNKERKNKDDEMGSLEIRNEETQTTIPTPLRSPRKLLSSIKNFFLELTDTISIPTTTTFKHSHVKKRNSSKYSYLSGALHRMCRHQAVTIIEDHDAFRSTLPAFVSQEFKTHVSKIITKLFKEYVQSNVIHVHPTIISSATPDSSAGLLYQLKESKRSKSARDSSSKHLSKESTKYVSKQQSQQHEWDAWEEENVIDEDEVIPDDETPELIAEFQNVDKRVPTIFDRATIEATLRDSLSNLSRNAKEYTFYLEQSTSFKENQIVWESRQQDIPRTIPKTLIFYRLQRNPNKPPRPLYNKDIFFLKYGNTGEKKIVTGQSYGLDYMEEILVMRANDKPDSFSEADFKYLNNNNIEDLYYLCQSKEIDNWKIKLMKSLITFIRSRVI